MSGDVLFIKTSSLGDVIHHMPALTEARARLPNHRFAWVVEEAFAPLVRLHPAASAVISVASRRWRKSWPGPSLWREVAGFSQVLRSQRYDAVVDTQGLIRSAMIARIARGCRHGYDSNSIRERAASLLYDVKHGVSRDQHAIARNRILTGLSLGYAPEGPPDFGLDRAALSDRSPERYAVLLHATARREKEWPVDCWIELGRSLGARGMRLVLPFGNARESERSRLIATALPEASVPEIQPLDSVARMIAGASLVVGVDTGLLHLASALSVPLVAIFVGSEPALTAPVGQGPMAIIGGKGMTPAAAEAIAAVDRLSVQ